MKTSILMVMGGPNGSGKSTVTNKLDIIGEYVNADEIQRILKIDSLKAAQIAEATREYLLENNCNFTFESVLSTERNYNLMERAKEKGYKVICIYVLTKDPEINIERVNSRKRNGGHDVPPEKIEKRYYRAMALIPRLFSVCDECYIYDNSVDRNQGEPSMIVNWQYGELKQFPNSIWTQKMIDDLIKGIYSPKSK